ncbi:cya3 [Symbiodinium microadriaticum]|nr:cya3 [Symbiodinium microadriaticum]
MFTDIVGYTALMNQDEHIAFAYLSKNRELQKPIVESFGGRWIKELGDGVMTSFNTVSDAVNAAIRIQENCIANNDFQLRIGIHLGEVVFENNDVFGDGVNIASRIQTSAEPGCIFVSESVQNNISNKNGIRTQFIREEQLKNVSQPIKIYQVLFSGSEVVKEAPEVRKVENSIAVLPFVNMTNEVEQEYFSDGISEEIINILAQVPDLKVIGRTSSFAFKGKNLDLTVIGEQLKVRYILEGSVRKSGNKLRITAQLINVSDGFHLYSEKFDRELEDVFAIQDEISLAILNAIKIKLLGNTRDTVLKKYTDNVDAYQLYLKARYYYNGYTPDAFKTAIEYLESAIKLEPEYAIAYAALSYCYMTIWYWGWIPAEHSLPKALDGARQSLRLDDNIADSYLAIGRVKLHYELNIKAAEIDFKKSIAINPNSAECHVQLAMCSAFQGNINQAHEHANLADQLDPFSLMNLWMTAVPYWIEGDLEKIFAYGNRIVDMEPNFSPGYSWIGAYYQESGRFDEAIAAYQRCVVLNPDKANLSILAIAYGLAGKTEKCLEVIERIKSIEGSELTANSQIGLGYASIGEFDIAFDYFDKALNGNEGTMLFVKYHLRQMPEFGEDPRTKNLMARLGISN